MCIFLLTGSHAIAPPIDEWVFVGGELSVVIDTKGGGAHQVSGDSRRKNEKSAPASTLNMVAYEPM